ncbi:RNA polymerase ECF family sigma subunit [Lachnotalea glycerini]|uniref:RNA polymerase ECF family sigma subunit n=1 Tax=Lachnotalea glycerini TaxID=1763509 RepID=A0A318EM67_9FIRM|nr:RNA polymerase sigma factor [Lachnotalea glycerini]PXV89195.1 RNA polymerase ECF family sigma subunit [Lachnotalea glycerini]
MDKNTAQEADAYKENTTEDELTIEVVITKYGNYIYNLALKLSSNPEDANDLAQETFIKAWKHIADVKEPIAIKKWLRTICVNEFRMMIRKEKRDNICYVENVEDLEKDSTLLINVSPLVIDEIQTTEEVIKLRNGCFLAMTRKLTLNQRITFSLIDMFGLSKNEVSEILGLSEKAVKGLLYRARMNLESFFQGHCSFLDINNPCSCTAWIEFMQNRSQLQEEMKQKIDILDYKERGYSFDSNVRQKILHYYNNMPDQRPSQEWYEKVIELVKKSYN